LPAMGISRLESRLRIPGLTKFESSVFCHGVIAEFAYCARVLLEFERYPAYLPFLISCKAGKDQELKLRVFKALQVFPSKKNRARSS
jgi:hypothetical protein